MKCFKRLARLFLVGMLTLGVIGDFENVYASDLKLNSQKPLMKEDIKYFSVMADGKMLWEIDYSPRADRQSFLYWDMKVPYESVALVDTEKMYNVFEDLLKIDFSQDLSEGENSDAVHAEIAVKYESGDEKKLQELTLQIKNKNKDGLYCCKAGEKELLVESEIIDRILNVKPYDLILKIPYIVDISAVSQVKVEMSDKMRILEKKAQRWELDGKSVSKDDFQKKYMELLDPMISGEILEKKEGTDRRCLLKIYYTCSKAEDCEVEFIEYDEENTIVSVNGKEFFFVSLQDVKNLIRKIEKW